MANVWSRLFGRPEEAESRLTVDDWIEQSMKYQGQFYPLVGAQVNSAEESIENSFKGYVNGAYKSNGIVFAVCQARASVFTEMRFAFQKLDDGRPGDYQDGPSLRALETPWPGGTTGELLARAISDVDMCGNHYALVQHLPSGPRIRRLRPDWVTIILTAPPDKALASDIAGYVYKPGDTKDPDLWEVFPIDGSNGTVAHWCPIPDPDAQYRGMSWLTPVLQEIMGDKAISRHKNKFFSNAATPNLAVSFKESVTPDQFQEFMRQMNAAHQGADNAYKTMYLGGGADVTVVGSDIKQMDFRTITGMGEVRIAAAGRVPPTIVGINDGLQGSSLNEGNFRSAKDLLGDAVIRPLWRSLCACYSVLIDVPTGTRLWYDDRDVAFLLEDRKRLADMQVSQVTAITRLVMNGFKPETAVRAVLENNMKYLEHTGLYSVQLLPPNISHPEKYTGGDSGGTGKAPPAATAKNNQKGRPSTKTIVEKKSAAREQLLDSGFDPETVDLVLRNEVDDDATDS